MPFPNEHAARIKNPGQFEDIRRSNDKLGDGIDAIFGIKTVDGERVSQIQAIRFDKKKFTADQAKAWLKDHDFKPIEFEPAIEKAQEASHGLATNEDGSCPTGYPVKRRDPNSGDMRCFKEEDTRENEDELPKSIRGLDVQQTFAAMQEMGRKFTKEEANFVERSSSPDVVCGVCRFYLRDPESETGQCQVVEGPIPWFATSDLYISSAEEARAVFGAAASEPEGSGHGEENAEGEQAPEGQESPDLVEAIEKMEFNNFFVIEGGSAKDLGSKVPADLVTTRNNAWAIVIENREDKTNKASEFMSLDAVGAESRARLEAEKTQDPKMVVILGKKVGHIRDTNQAVYKDRNGYRYILNDVEEAFDDLEEGIRPAFGSSGGKRFLAKTIIGFIPDHEKYVEAFIGGGAVFFGKKPSPREIINDKDRDIAHAYKFIKAIGGEGSQRITELKKMPTTFSRATFFKLRDSSPSSDIGRFHRFLYLNAFSFGKSMTSTVKEENGGSFGPLTHRLERLPQIADRLKETIVLNADFREVVRAHDGPNTFFYLDPPYPDQQGHLKTDLTNDDIAATARRIKGSFIISLPDTKDVRRAFRGFNIRKVSVRRTMEMKAEHTDSEVLISNFPMRQRSEWLG